MAFKNREEGREQAARKASDIYICIFDGREQFRARSAFPAFDGEKYFPVRERERGWGATLEGGGLSGQPVGSLLRVHTPSFGSPEWCFAITERKGACTRPT
ncbi:hypothetical protein CRG98_024897 [Punica granatum]|uniref:Uncharacterized protein n=1 Tax=Punica granatum TaxID=22663 RepID=A0A2I0JEN4_PUNGR|nr:hypothetical protein CRG98_024897 [Punica granatum]